MLRERFTPFGEIVQIQIVRDPMNKQSRYTPPSSLTHLCRVFAHWRCLRSGFGFITFAQNEEGENAVNTLNGSDINGRPIRVEHARRSVGHVKTPGRCTSSTS
jgi:RNA recognition motif-containing protein